jgi:hypothetical protein
MYLTSLFYNLELSNLTLQFYLLSEINIDCIKIKAINLDKLIISKFLKKYDFYQCHEDHWLGIKFTKNKNNYIIQRKLIFKQYLINPLHLHLVLPVKYELSSFFQSLIFISDHWKIYHYYFFDVKEREFFEADRANQKFDK